MFQSRIAAKWDHMTEPAVKMKFVRYACLIFVEYAPFVLCSEAPFRLSIPPPRCMNQMPMSQVG